MPSGELTELFTLIHGATKRDLVTLKENNNLQYDVDAKIVGFIEFPQNQINLSVGFLLNCGCGERGRNRTFNLLTKTQGTAARKLLGIVWSGSTDHYFQEEGAGSRSQKSLATLESGERVEA
jgi:hypothetical protein